MLKHSCFLLVSDLYVKVLDSEQSGRECVREKICTSTLKHLDICINKGFALTTYLICRYRIVIVCGSTNQPTNQSIDHPTKQPIDQSINQSNSQPTNQSTNS